MKLFVAALFATVLATGCTKNQPAPTTEQAPPAQDTMGAPADGTTTAPAPADGSTPAATPAPAEGTSTTGQ